jgi:2-octaprenyl-6-methoxyphenol hydroxylase
MSATTIPPSASSLPSSSDLLIVGGGLIGLSLALATARAGLRTIVVDREPTAALLADAHDGRASAIACGSRRILEGIGVWPHVAEAEPILDIRVSDGPSRLFLHYDHREVGDEPLGHIVENRFLRRALHQATTGVPGLHLAAPATVAAIERHEGAIEVTLADGQKVASSLLIGADGRQSAVRRWADIPVTGWRYGQTAIVCTVALERPHRGVAHERFLPAGPFALLPMATQRGSIVWTERPDMVPALLALDDLAFSAEMTRRFGGWLGPLHVVGGRWSYPLDLTVAERYIAPRLALIGDAAHGMHPIAGQGLNVGLRDVAALAEAVVDAHRLGLDVGALDVLETYQRRRRFEALSMAAATDAINRLFSNDLPPVRLVRDLGLALVDRLPPVKRVFMRHAMGLLGDLPRLTRGRPL